MLFLPEDVVMFKARFVIKKCFVVCVVTIDCVVVTYVFYQFRFCRFSTYIHHTTADTNATTVAAGTKWFMEIRGTIAITMLAEDCASRSAAAAAHRYSRVGKQVAACESISGGRWM